MKKSILFLAIGLFSCMPAKAEKFFETCSRQIASKIISSTRNKEIDDYVKDNIFGISGKDFFTIAERSGEAPVSMFAKWNPTDEWLDCYDESRGRSNPPRMVCGDSFRFHYEFSSILPSDSITIISRNGVVISGRYVGVKIISCEVSITSPQPRQAEYSGASPTVTYPYLLSWISKVKLNNVPKEFYLKFNYRGLTRPVDVSPEF
jgi:hypothetical protein